MHCLHFNYVTDTNSHKINYLKAYSYCTGGELPIKMLVLLHSAVPKALGAFSQVFWLKDGNEVKIWQNFSTDKSKHRDCSYFISNGQRTLDETLPNINDVFRFVPSNLSL